MCYMPSISWLYNLNNDLKTPETGNTVGIAYGWANERTEHLIPHAFSHFKH